MGINVSANECRVAHLAQRSRQLHAAIMSRVQAPPDDAPLRHELAYRMILVVFEQAAGLRQLTTTGLVTTAACLMRVQFETLLRAVWLMSAADDDAPGHLAALLKPEGESAACQLPGISEMLDRMDAVNTAGPPSPMTAALHDIRSVSWHTLHSFVHGGINERLMYSQLSHTELAPALMMQGNRVLAVAGQALALIMQDDALRQDMSKLPSRFADCLPADGARPESKGIPSGTEETSMR